MKNHNQTGLAERYIPKSTVFGNREKMKSVPASTAMIWIALDAFIKRANLARFSIATEMDCTTIPLQTAEFATAWASIRTLVREGILDKAMISLDILDKEKTLFLSYYDEGDDHPRGWLEFKEVKKEIKTKPNATIYDTDSADADFSARIGVWRA